MLITTRLIKHQDKPSLPPLDTLTLDREARFKRRVRLVTDGGRDLLIDLHEASYFADGDVFEVDGGLIEVKAAPEALYEIHAHDALSLARIAWHLGNRHTSAEITEHAIYIKPDHVLAEMLSRFGVHMHEVMRPFEPEGGAYGGHGTVHSGGHHHHGHGHSHDHHYD